MATASTTDIAIEREVFWERHKNEVMGAIIAILVALVAFGGYRFYKDRQEKAAANMLAGAKTPAELQKVISDYSGTPAGGTAYLLLADAQKAEKKFAEANSTLETFLQKFPKHELAGTARLAIAGNLESLGKPDEALATYQKLATSEPHAYTAPVALFSQIHLLKEKKQIAEARKVCETLMTQYRESRFSAEAAYNLRTLKLPDQPAATQPPAVVAPAAAPPAPAVAAPPSQSAPPPPVPQTSQAQNPAAPPAPKKP